MVQRQAQEKGRSHEEISASMKLTRGRLKIDVLIHLRLCSKESEAGEPVKVHFRYKALNSQEQQVARFLRQSSQTLTMSGLGGSTVLVHTI